ncbi:ABC transporter ATP-binding protein [uncultured Methylibium sp.]|uniref:ABC transporter ATP-binding protein n=1 Tax=uncultured Methylibium sp. TaxID=381093 RepID=UPI0025E718EB|nr:ABC transporter ATP-binding protein [uncultured Methylibium sp.]
MDTAPPLLRLQALDKRYPGGTQALAGLTLEVGVREFVALLGPSGCGKSTVLRLIAGLERPDAGSLQWSGAVPTLGYVFQEPTLMPWATVADNVYLPLRLQGRTRGEAAAAIDAMLARVGLADFAHAYPRELSGGMKMRVSIARALVTRPGLLLMDEPFAALDELTRQQLGEDLLAIQAEQGFAVVFVTHSVHESAYLADRVLVMSPRPGRVAAESRIDEARPRGEAYRLSARYDAHRVAVSRALRDAMASASDHA